MDVKILKPKTAIDLFAGLTGIMFERVAGPMPVSDIAVKPDDLTAIDGIGKTYAQRLNAGGVYTFADLAALSPDAIREIVQLKTWQGDPEEWIAEARLRAH